MTKQQLQHILNDYNSHELKEIHLIWTNGDMAGIGNYEMKCLVMNTLKEELTKRIAELS